MNNLELFKATFEMKQNTHRQNISKDFKADIDYDLRVLISNERKEAKRELFEQLKHLKKLYFQIKELEETLK